jgi:hypothetical protein
MRNRIAKTMLHGCLLLLLCITASALESRFDVTLFALHPTVTVAPGGAVTGSEAELLEFSLNVVPKVGRVRYGSIRIQVNDEAVGTYTTVSGTDEGYRCSVNLKSAQRSILHEGSNNVVLFFTDTWNQRHTAAFSVFVLAPPKPT